MPVGLVEFGSARRRIGVCPPAGSRGYRERRREQGFLEVPEPSGVLQAGAVPPGTQPQPFPARSRRLAGLPEFLALAVAAEPLADPVRGV